MDISSELKQHGKRGFDPDAERIPYLFYPQQMNGGIFEEIYISLVRANDFSYNSINSNAIFKDLIRIENQGKGFQRDWQTGSIFDKDNPLREMSDQEEWDYLKQYSEEYEKDFLENYVYSDSNFIDLYGRSVALILLYFSTINNLKRLIHIAESFFIRDKTNFNVLREFNQIQIQFRDSRDKGRISEIVLLISKLETLMNLYNANYSKLPYKSMEIQSRVHDLSALSVKVREVRNKFSHGQWDDMKIILQDISVMQAFKVVKRLYELIEVGCNWNDIEFIKLA